MRREMMWLDGIFMMSENLISLVSRLRILGLK